MVQFGATLWKWVCLGGSLVTDITQFQFFSYNWPFTWLLRTIEWVGIY